MASSDPADAIGPSLTTAELDDANQLVREAGWNQLDADWRIFLDLGAVHAVRTAAGRVIATAAMLPYGGRFAWISMVLVAGAHRRRGLATRLLQRCIDDLAAVGLVPVLDAAPAGRAVYGPLGFRDAWSFTRWAAPQQRPRLEAIRSPAGPSIRPIDDADWPAVCACDAAAFGADRTRVLERLRGRLPAAALVAEQRGRITGFLLGRDGGIAAQLGPLVAADDETAQALLVCGLGAVGGPLCIDVVDAKAALGAALAGIGFITARPFTRMVYRRATGFADPLRTYAVAGPELG
jgi:GNAT superfamily N-acetyltransferase